MDDDDDGIFCMTFRDFCTHFREATVCKLRVVEGEESNWHEVCHPPTTADVSTSS